MRIRKAQTLHVRYLNEIFIILKELLGSGIGDKMENGTWGYT